MEKQKTTLVDSGRSWVIAFSCCLINFLLYGVARLSGLWMVSAVETFQVNRASAALPFSVSTSVRNLSGLFVGYLGQRFGLRVVIATGCLLASLGTGLCFFVTDITWIVVSWGGIFGLGFGLATCLLPLAINEHFDVYRGTASGISYSGSYIGSFLLSPLVIRLLNEYGLSGTFIVISATFLNGFAVAMLFHKPRKVPSSFQQPREEFKDSASRDVASQSFLNQFREMWLRLWKKIKSQSCVIKSKKLLTLPNVSSIFAVDSPPIYDQIYQSAFNDRSNCELTFYTNFSQIQKNSRLFEKLPLEKVEETPDNFNRTFLLKKKTKVRLKKKFTKFKKSLRKKDKKHYSLYELTSHHPFDSIELVSYKSSKLLPSKASAVEKYSVGNTLHRGDTLWSNHSYQLTSRQNYQESISNCILLKIEPIYKKGVCETYMQDVWNPIHDQGDLKYHVEDFSNSSPLASRFYQKSTPEKTFFTTLENVTANIPVSFEKTPKSGCLLMKDAFKCLFGWSRLYTEPMFVVIAITMSMHTFVIVCMITIIEDFAKDIRIPECQVHYVLMVLSMADLVGSLTLGAITDRGFLSRLNFLILCFFGMAICQLCISLVRSFAVLLTLVVIYGLFESGIIITFPLLIAHFIPQKKQPTAVASSNFLSAPSVLLVPLVIGYFRDRTGGCYKGVFYCLGVTSLSCCLIWFLVPKMLTCRKKKCSSPMPINKSS